jgi:hypothetical protein
MATKTYIRMKEGRKKEENPIQGEFEEYSIMNELYAARFAS